MEDEVKKQEGGGGAPKWMCTFADLMSLLLCFFVLLLSFSVMDNQRYKQVAGSMKDAFGLKKDSRTDISPKGSQIISQNFQTIPLDMQVKIEEILQSELSAGFVEAENSVEGLTLRVKNSLAFAPGSVEIDPSFLPFLEKLGRITEEMEIHVSVTGHTDNLQTERGDFKSNWELSAARAVTVVEFWQSKYDIPSERLAAIGYAEGRPLASNDTEEGRSRNRRVEFMIRPHKPRYAFEGIQIMD